MEKIKNILDENCRVYGFCSFDEIKDYLIDCRAKSRIPSNAQTIITVLFPYYLGEEAYEKSNVSRYAAVRDYHEVATLYLSEIAEKLKELYPENEFVFFADNSPIPEVYAAAKSGVGVKGKNGLLINEKYGSWIFIGEIVTDLYIPCENKEIKLCHGCSKCLDACPTGVLKEEKFDPDRCLSHISQKKGEIPEEYAVMMKNLGCAWGCDECQKACPYNKNAEKTTLEEFVNSAKPFVTENTEIEGRAFAWRGEKVIKRNLRTVSNEF